MKRIRFHIVFLAVLCMAATPALAEHFGFSYSNLRTTFDGVDSFVTTPAAFPLLTVGSVYRNQPPAGTAITMLNSLIGPDAFLISMTISDITATTAVGSGSFAIKDIHGDTIGGDLSGTWVKAPQVGAGVFTGSMTNVTFTSVVDTNFDGNLFGSVSMLFSDPGPWSGVLVQLTAPSGWFTDQFGAVKAFDVTGGSIDAVLPVPGALLLGMLGLGAAGVKLRKFA
jgi:hypothetical protein